MTNLLIHKAELEEAKIQFLDKTDTMCQTNLKDVSLNLIYD